MSSYKQFDHLRIPLEKILSATDNFSDANLVKSDGFGKEYIGQLLRSDQLVDIVARRLNNKNGIGNKEFWMEVSMLYSLEHQNIVSMVGFCDEKGEKIVINKRETCGSLYNYLRDPALTWMRRLEICVGVSRALSYIYYDEGRDFSVIHRDIKSCKILLDDNWEAKLSGFELSMNQAAAERHHPCQLSYNEVCGTMGYVDPTYVNTGSVSHKSDMFSLGVVLMEVLCSQETEMVKEDEMYLYQLATWHYENGRLYFLLNSDLRKQMDKQSFKIFSEIAYWCLKAEPSERPSIDQIVIELEKALESQQEHENHKNRIEDTTSKNIKFDQLRIPLEKIVSATDNFSDANLIEVDGFVKAYKGQLLRSGQLVDIVARRLDSQNGQGNKEFWMEVSILYTLEHQNIVSMVGFCDEKGEKIVIIERETRGSLYNYLSDPKTLTWMRRLQICVGIARALSYIHYDEGHDFSVIHSDIKSSKILLDNRWEAKISGFELSLNQAAAERNNPCQLSEVNGTLGYLDPTYFNTGIVSHKSDVFSFGVVLMEVLCGQGTEMVYEDEMYLYQFAKSHYEIGRLYFFLNSDLRKQMGKQSFKIISDLAYCCLEAEPSERPSIDQILIQLEKALESQQEHENYKKRIEDTTSKTMKFAHLQIPLEEIVSATKNFSDANLIGRDGFRKEYKGKLLRSDQLVDIVARRFLGETFWGGNKGFFMEVSMLSKLEHKNIVSIIGFCDENGEKIVINKHEANGSLDSYLRDPTLTWMRRLQICVGAAHALSYIYYDKRRDFSIIHRDIKSSKILLDEQWEAKLSGFELSITQTASRRDRLCLTDVCGTIGYCDPTYVESGSVTHKSDMYSFGIVLFEVLCGKEVRIAEEDTIRCLLAASARSHYERGRLEDMIDPGLLEQMDPQSFKIFSETAYYCLKEHRPQRPNIHQIVRKLEKALKFQWKHQNPAHSIVKGMTSRSLKGKDLKHLEIPLTDIQLATKNFAKTCLIGLGTYGEVYKAELDHFDSKNLLPFEEKMTREHTKKRSTVAIKRILSREDKQGIEGFLAEIEMLTSCKHPNIISLLGFCKEGDHMILVYEHASKGSLSDYLGSTGNFSNLSWVQRIKICIDIAHGLNYLHTKIEDDRRIIHRDIKSDNILLSENWQAKIADFGLSRLRSETESQQVNKTLYTETLAGTDFYWDPEYFKTGRLKNESDIYSFGVVLFEILSGKLASDAIYTKENINGIAPVARRRFNEGTIREMVDPLLMEETHESLFTSSRGPDQDSLDTFTKIAYQCLAESQTNRPTAEVIIKKLEEALSSQENVKDHLKFSLDEIKTATQGFSRNNLIGSGAFGSVYKGEVTHANVRNAIAAKRWDARGGQGEQRFLMELQILLEYKHENCIGLVGYCNEMGEKITVYEYAFRGSLDGYLEDKGLTWRKRLEICIDIASGLDFLHGGGVAQEPVIHRNITSSNVLLTHDWKGNISDFGLSLISPLNKDMEFVIDVACGSAGYMDPLYMELGFLTAESDIYSLGVVLFEILSGRAANLDFIVDRNEYLSALVKNNFNEGKLDEMVFEGIKEQIVPNSLTTFQMIAYQCLHDENKKRPTSRDVQLQLKKSLEFQEDFEIWEPKLPNDCEQIFKMSNFSEIYSTAKKKDLHNMLSTGIVLQEGKLWFSLGANGERNTMIPARKFLYKRRSHKWRSVPNSRFQKVAEMLDVSNLKIQMKIKTQLLSPGVNYGIHLVFRICGPRKSLAKQMYVNLKYKKGSGSETLHAYFATWREDGWMMIELCRFSNDKEDIDFEFLLESLSRYYCGSHGVYVEGIEFRAIDNVKHEETDEIQEVQQVLKSDSNMHLMQQLPTNLEEIFKRSENQDDDEKLFLLNQVNGKKHLMLSPKAALYNYSDIKLFKTKPSIQSRFSEVIELLPQQVLRINCKIKSHSLSRDTDYACYLVFKLSEKCRGLHCPVKVRNLLHRNNKEVGVIYFRPLKPWNLHDTNQAPQQRADDWMEVKVWKFNLNHEFIKNDSFRVNLKLISYEGTLSGLIFCGLEFRPM